MTALTAAPPTLQTADTYRQPAAAQPDRYLGGYAETLNNLGLAGTSSRNGYLRYVRDLTADPDALAAVVLAAGVPAAASGTAGNARSGVTAGGTVFGQVDLVSCPSAGNCAAAGSFGNGQKGSWSTRQAAGGARASR